MRDVITPGRDIRGEVRAHRVSPGVQGYQVAPVFRKLLPGWCPVSEFAPNAILYEWGAIFGALLRRQGLNYGIGGMYFEFENVGTPGDPVSAPAFDRGPDEGVNYYNGLSGSGDRDYLRVPLLATTSDSTDEAKFPHGNRPSFFAQTTGVEGVHGKPFSDANNSVVFGGALVSFVDDTDHTRDLVLSRFYLEPAQQLPKLATGQIGFEWRLTLG